MPFDPHASFGKSLFFGEILEEQLFPYPEMAAETQDTVKELLGPVRKFLSTVDVKKMDRTAELQPGLLDELKGMGLFGLIVPEEFGGLGLSSVAYARVLQEISGLDSPRR